MASFPIRYPGTIRIQVRIFDALSEVDRSTVQNAFELHAPDGVSAPNGDTVLPVTDVLIDSEVNAKVINLKLSIDISDFTPAQDGVWELKAKGKVRDVQGNRLAVLTPTATVTIQMAEGQKNDLLPPDLQIETIEEVDIPTPLAPNVLLQFENNPEVTEVPEDWEIGESANPTFTSLGLTIGAEQSKTYNKSSLYGPEFTPVTGQEVVIEFYQPEKVFTPDSFDSEGNPREESASHVGLGIVNFRNADSIALMSHGLLHDGDYQYGPVDIGATPGDKVQLKILFSLPYALVTMSVRNNSSWEVRDTFFLTAPSNLRQSTRVVLDSVRLPLIITKVSF